MTLKKSIRRKLTHSLDEIRSRLRMPPRLRSASSVVPTAPMYTTTSIADCRTPPSNHRPPVSDEGGGVNVPAVQYACAEMGQLTANRLFL